MFARALVLALATAFLAESSWSAEVKLDFRDASAGQTPPHFSSAVTGPGSVGNWKVIDENIPPILAPLSSNAQLVADEPVLSASSADPDSKHLSVLLYTNDTYQDVTLTTRLKITGGLGDPSAGIVFRALDANNYYVLRVGAQGYLLWHRVVDGKSLDNLGIGVRTPIPENEWLELKVVCHGSSIRGFLNGKLLIPPAKPGAPTDTLAVNDSTFSSGQIGFWIKGDTKAEFADARLEFVPRTPYMQSVAEEIVKKYPRLLNLQIYGPCKSGPPAVIASKNAADIGTIGAKAEQDVFDHGMAYVVHDKSDGWVEVTLPLRDRNGDITAAVKTRMERFHGETQDTAVARALVVKKAIEQQLDTMRNIMQ